MELTFRLVHVIYKAHVEITRGSLISGKVSVQILWPPPPYRTGFTEGQPSRHASLGIFAPKDRHLDTIWVNPKDQGHRSKIRVTDIKIWLSENLSGFPSGNGESIWVVKSCQTFRKPCPTFGFPRPWFLQAFRLESHVKKLAFQQCFWVSRKASKFAPWSHMVTVLIGIESHIVTILRGIAIFNWWNVYLNILIIWTRVHCQKCKTSPLK